MAQNSISLIVPVYNAENYLHRCIDSILTQTFKDFELLLIDDGSTDLSPQICDEYAKVDARIQAFHKKNGGVSSARNFGISRCRAKYVAFIDCDDEVEGDYLETLHYQIERSNSQLVCSYAKVFQNGKYSHENHSEGIIDSNITIRYITSFELRTNSAPWGKLFTKSIIDDYEITFDEKMSIGEDTLFLFEYLTHCDRVSIINKTCYHYYINEQSLVRKINPTKSELYSYHRINEICTVLLSNEQEGNIELILEIGKMRAAYIRRVLNSLYYYPTRARTRRETIQSIDTKSYYTHHQTNSVLERTYMLLLRHNMLLLYDALRVVASWIKA